MADIVALPRRDLSQNTCRVTFVQHGSAAGCLYEPGAGFDQYAYLVFDPDCDADRLNLAHELGHQLGMEHDPRNSDMPVGSGNPSCPWSFAHRGTTAPYGFRTVMATPDPGHTFIVGPACTSDSACPKIDAFANPQLQWTGASGGVQPLGTVPGAPPIGVATPPHQGYRARAVDTLPRLAPISAAFRARPEVIFADDFE
jgi:hypothetical protein